MRRHIRARKGIGNGQAVITRHHEWMAGHTTLKVGGPAQTFVVAQTEAELIAAVRDADEREVPVFVFGSGSNLIFNDFGWEGVVVKVATTGMTYESAACAGATVTVAAGESWDAFVEHAIANDWSGVEALSGIPGTVGATPIQNVGAYGQDVAQTIARVRAYDRQTKQIRTFYAADCGFGYRTSVFKQHAPRLVILDVQFQLRLGEQSMPVTYPELAARLGIEVGARSTSRAVRDAVLALRTSKGMVLDESDHDTWSAGSFFLNPTVERWLAPAQAPQWDAGDDKVKVSAAWLVENSGTPKGYALGNASTSTKHALAITNRGGASADSIMQLARLIQERVRVAYSIDLQIEPQFISH